MKFHLIAAVLSCGLLSLSYANVSETEQSLSQPQNAAVDESLSVASPEVQKVLIQIPEIVQEARKEQITDDDAEAIVFPQSVQAPLPNSRVPKQLISFIPTSVLREAIRMAQEEQPIDVRSVRYENEADADDFDFDSDEIEEERAVRRRKRFRRRNAQNHLKKSHRHRNTNNRKRLNVTKKRKVPKQRKSTKRRKSATRKPQKKKRKTSKRKNNKIKEFSQ